MSSMTLVTNAGAAGEFPDGVIVGMVNADAHPHICLTRGARDTHRIHIRTVRTATAVAADQIERGNDGRRCGLFGQHWDPAAWR